MRMGPTAPAPPTVPTLVLSGVVAENGQPIDNARVEVSGLQSCSSGCSSRQFNAGSGMTDVAGRYRIDIRRPEEASATVWAIARRDGYVQQCVATTTMQTDTQPRPEADGNGEPLSGAPAVGSWFANGLRSRL